jgi:hypothetical protein
LHLSVIAAVCFLPLKLILKSRLLKFSIAYSNHGYLCGAIVLKYCYLNGDQINKITTTQIMQGNILGFWSAYLFSFVLINFGKESAFLLAAKSIFRFGDLKESKDVKLTEYILIGTLLSFGSGILCAMVYKYLQKFVENNNNVKKVVNLISDLQEELS